jgi:hypothetical protein
MTRATRPSVLVWSEATSRGAQAHAISWPERGHRSTEPFGRNEVDGLVDVTRAHPQLPVAPVIAGMARIARQRSGKIVVDGIREPWALTTMAESYLDARHWAALPSFSSPHPVMKPRTRRDPYGTPRAPDNPGHDQGPARTGPDLRLAWSGRRDSNPRPPPWQGCKGPSPDLRRSPHLAGELRFSFACNGVVSRCCAVLHGTPTGPRDGSRSTTIHPKPEFDVAADIASRWRVRRSPAPKPYGWRAIAQPKSILEMVPS